MVEQQRQKWPLPPGTMPIGLSRLQVAAYIGVSTTLYDRMVEDGRMPRPKRVNRRNLWDRREVEAFFAKLDDPASDSPGDAPEPGSPDGEDWDDVAP